MAPINPKECGKKRIGDGAKGGAEGEGVAIKEEGGRSDKTNKGQKPRGSFYFEGGELWWSQRNGGRSDKSERIRRDDRNKERDTRSLMQGSGEG